MNRLVIDEKQKCNVILESHIKEHRQEILDLKSRLNQKETQWLEMFK
jgi:hypothetical protein